MNEKHNHVTRDIKPLGQCPACDEYHDRNIPMKSNKTIAESITGISYEEIKSLANNEAKSKFLGDQLRLTYVDGYKAGFDKGAEEMAKIKDEEWEKRVAELVEALKYYSNEEDNDTYLDIFDCIKKPSKSTTEFDEVKFGKVAREALEKFRKEVK